MVWLSASRTHRVASSPCLVVLGLLPETGHRASRTLPQAHTPYNLSDCLRAGRPPAAAAPPVLPGCVLATCCCSAACISPLRRHSRSLTPAPHFQTLAPGWHKLSAVGLVGPTEQLAARQLPVLLDGVPGGHALHYLHHAVSSRRLVDY